MCAGCGASSHGRVSLTIKLTEYKQGVLPAQAETQSFSLTCNPLGGTLPFAATVCRDIWLHPLAMLHPSRRHSVCLGSPWSPELTVRGSAEGKQITLSGIPFCEWPGGTALGLYWSATQKNQQTIASAESRLRCDEDPVLLAQPTPLASVNACVHGHWTPRSERLIRAAEQAPAIARLRPRRLFPHDIGARRCTIPVRGRSRRTYAGLCGVYLKHVWSGPTVTLMEAWPRATHGMNRHLWRFVIRDGRAVLVHQGGPKPPQE
jgi:hypothetical protein